ncbi:MAG: CPBP family intramembrane metalloprotease [Bacteroidetes bacterium]|nr:CPBP family intramembrane metalloprotease [Bacteroidota bacterium]
MSETIENEAGLFQSQQTRYRPSSFALAALGILFVLYQFVGGGLTVLIIGTAITPDNVMSARWATMLAQILFLLLPTLYLAKRQNGSFADVFSFRMPSFREWFLGLAGMLALMQVAETYLYLQNMIPVPEPLAPYIQQFKDAIAATFKMLLLAESLPEMLFVLLVAAVTPAVCEELMFRGLIQRNFTLAYGGKLSFVYTGTIFALYHMNPFWLLPLIALGIYFSFLQYRSRSLWLPIAAHLINNGAATVGAFIYGSTDDTTPTLFLGAEAEPSMAAVLGTGGMFAVLFFLLINQYIRVTERIHTGEES